MKANKYSLYKKKRKSKKIVIVICIIVAFVTGSALLMKTFENKSRDSIVGKWKSDETGQVVNFMNDGVVKIDSSNITGTYHIISPSSMQYTVSDIDFEMFYKIEDNKLYWGTIESDLEIFSPH